MKLDHIGIATDNLEYTLRKFNDVLGLDFDSPEEVHSQGVKVSFSKNKSSKLEFLEGTTEKSKIYPILDNPIKSFIKKNGPGIHHLCFEVANLEDKIKELESKGHKVLGGLKLNGHDGEEVVFLESKNTDNILIELKNKKIK